MCASSPHTPVLLEAALAALEVARGGWYLDATFGCGGHSRAILSALKAHAFPKPFKLWALDRDAQVLPYLEPFQQEPAFHFIEGRFSELASKLAPYQAEAPGGGWNGLLFDLGVSSPQLDQAGRGFSFLRDGPLDMRMDNQRGVTASDWLQQVSLEELEWTLRWYGEERYARRIARQLVEHREKQGVIASTGELAELVLKALPGSAGAWKGKHPATRSFQAIRMAVNEEVEELTAALQHAVKLLAPGGRLLFITFHGIEVRLLRKFLRDPQAQREIRGERYQLKLESRVFPSLEEVQANPRSRSATLWCSALRPIPPSLHARKEEG